MRSTLELAEVPSLGSLYAKALGTQAKGLLPGRESPLLVLPRVEHRVAGVRVDRDHLVAYQRLMGDTVREELPSVFVHGLAFPVAMSVMVRGDFPLPLLGMVHLANSAEHLRPVSPAAELSVLAYAADLREHRAGTQLDLVAEVREGTELVWRGVSTYLARGVWPGPKPAGEPAPWDPFAAPTRTGAWVLPGNTGRAYAAVMGDYNPIHLWAPTAKALGMKRAIAHGMYLAGRALAGAAPHSAGYSWNIEFSTPVFLPSTVDVAFGDEERTTVFSGWGARSGKPHFAGSIVRS